MDKIKEIYECALVRLGGRSDPLLFGPGHIVWGDNNFDCAEWCLENFDDYRGLYSDDDLAIVRESLEELCKIPIDVRIY